MPIVLEHCVALDIGPFRDELAKPNCIWSGVVRWFSGDRETSSISYRLNSSSNRPWLTLLYSIYGRDVTQTVELVSVPSNLNRGQYWLFICPICGRRCKKLHLIRGLFQHRTALPGVFYRQQARTKWAFGRYLDAHYKVGEVWEAAEAPYFREHYAGKPTRRCLRMLRKLKKWAPRMSEAEGLRILRGGR